MPPYILLSLQSCWKGKKPISGAEHPIAYWNSCCSQLSKQDILRLHFLAMCYSQLKISVMIENGEERGNKPFDGFI